MTREERTFVTTESRISWNENATISIEAPARPKKLTGTRFANALGKGSWATPFQTWCEITKTCTESFVDTPYTTAGKAIEPKQIAYLREAYGMDDLRDPTDLYGPDYFRQTHGDFFEHPVFGGMWDAITVDASGEATSVLEFKTTKRATDWAADIPEHYALQAALYAWLLDCDEVIMIVTFLQDGDYEHPEDFVVSADNTATFEFRLSDRYPTFERDYVEAALTWWDRHVVSGDSPTYDERADADYLKALRTTHLSPTDDVRELLADYGRLSERVATHDAETAADRERLDAVRAKLRSYAVEHLGTDADTVIFGDGTVSCRLTRTRKTVIDEQRLRADGLLGRYSTQRPGERFTVSVAGT